MLEDQWEERASLLEQFKDREGHCGVPMSYTEDGSNLGRWLRTQRAAKKNRKLGSYKEQRLEEIGAVWGVITEQWEESFSL